MATPAGSTDDDVSTPAAPSTPSGLGRWKAAAGKVKVIQTLGRLKFDEQVDVHCPATPSSASSGLASSEGGDDDGRRLSTISTRTRRVSFLYGQGGRRRSQYVLSRERRASQDVRASQDESTVGSRNSIEARSSGMSSTASWLRKMAFAKHKAMSYSTLVKRNSQHLSPPGVRNSCDTVAESEADSDADSNGDSDNSQERASQPGGALLDFLCRKTFTLPPTFFYAGITECVQTLMNPLVDGDTVKHLKTNFPACEEIIDSILEERLLFYIQEDICYFWRRRNDPAWKEKGPSQVAKHIFAILRYKKQAACIGAEIDMIRKQKEALGMQKKAANLKAKEREDARHARLQCFWRQLHRNSRAESVVKMPDADLVDFESSQASSPSFSKDAIKRPFSSPEVRRACRPKQPIRCASASQASPTQRSLGSPSSSPENIRPGQQKPTAHCTSASPLASMRRSLARPASSPEMKRTSTRDSQVPAMQTPPPRPASSQSLRRQTMPAWTGKRFVMGATAGAFTADPADTRSAAHFTTEKARASSVGVLQQQLAELRRPISAQEQQNRRSGIKQGQEKAQAKASESRPVRSTRKRDEKQEQLFIHVKERDFRKLGKVPRQLSCPVGMTGLPDRREAVVSDLCSEVSEYFMPKHLQMRPSVSLPNLLNSESPTSRRVQAFIHEEWSPVSHSPTSSPTQAASDCLLPANGKFSFPWDIVNESKGEATEQILAGEKYLKACDAQKAVPMALPFVTGHSSKLLGAAQAMSDADIQAITGMLSGLQLEELDLADNPLLTDKSLVPFLETLIKEPEMQRTFRRLRLCHCTQAGMGTYACLIRLLGRPPPNLQEVSLNGVLIARSQQFLLCQALSLLPELRTLRLANVGIQGSCVCELVLSKTLQELDLSWNCFDAAVFEQFGNTLVETGSLQRLALSNSSTAKQMAELPAILTFIECLTRDNSLRYLDVSTNRLDFRGALVIEDALERHRKMETLNVSNNPFGVLGMRSLMRLLAHDSSALLEFNCENCSLGQANTTEVSAEQFLSLTTPGGRYVLDLALAYHRALLRLLCKTCERLKLTPESVFTSVSYTAPPRLERGGKPGSPTSHGGFRCSKDEQGIWNVPSQGRLRVVFSLETAMSAALKDVPEWDLRAVLDKYFDTTLMKFSFKKLASLCSWWKTLEDPLEREMFLQALSQDFQISLPAINQLCSVKQVAVGKDVLQALLPGLIGGQSTQFLAKMLTASVTDYVVLMKKIKAFAALNANSPTGHYSLRLHNLCDYAVAQRLVLLDCWEMGLAQRSGHRDTSQRGNRSQIRNERYNGAPIFAPSMELWAIPTEGKLELDYVSVLRPSSKNCPVIDKVTFENILLVLGQSECSSERHISAIRAVAHTFYLDARQLRMLLGTIALPELRVEVLTVLFLRVVDIHSEKVLRVRLNVQEVQTVQRRLGFATFFPFIQPEQMKFTLSLEFHDQRLATNILCALADKERRENMREISFIHEDGIVDPLLMGVPRSWSNLAQIPDKGVFKAQYICAPEDRSFKTRRMLLQTFGRWLDNTEEKDVQWWAGLEEAPEDVRMYLEFLVPRFPNVNDAYRVISRGAGMISFSGFEESILKMKCMKFKGPDELHRIRQIFRYLDPSGEGQVSLQEWGILDLLWREIRLCIEEFDQFLTRTFENDMAFAWDFFDEDKNDNIDAAEWCHALATVGYFGPALPIFKYIDRDDGGTISWDEFKDFKVRIGINK